MGVVSSCCGSGIEQDLNTKVEKLMQAAERGEKNYLKLLFLGTGDSGKTTVFKQMRILYGEGYSEDARLILAPAIISNLITGTKSILAACEGLSVGSPLRRSDAKRAARVVMGCRDHQVLTADVARSIAVLWQDRDFQATWARRSSFQVLDGYSEFAEQVHKFPKWGGPDWVPSLSDAIRARVRTSGIVEETFVIDGVTFKMFDVGGQRNERRKWIHCFDGVTAVIFMAAISEYDQFLFEDKSQNRIVEALELFKEISNSSWFTESVMILFLNKVDLFKEKYCDNRVPLNKSGFFPDAPRDPEFRYDVAKEYFKKKFLQQTRKPVYTHFTCALDTDYIKRVFNVVKNEILKKSLISAGFMETDDF